MSQRYAIEIGDLASMLADRIEQLVAELLPRGQRQGHEWVDAKRKHGGLGDGLSVHLSASKRGVWAHFGDGHNVNGDSLDLVAYLLFQGDKHKAINWSKAWLGIDNADPKALQSAKRRATESRSAAEQSAAADAKKRAGRARAMWLGGQKLVPGCPAWVYLAGRGCDLSALDRAPGALRYHPALFNAEIGADRPALVASITTRDGQMAAHRTWLQPDPHNPGNWVKLAVPNPKKTYGNYRGGCIRLWRGASGKPMAQAQPGELVCITEGIEDGLTVAIAKPDARVLVAVSLANMAHIELPDAIEEVVICADNDPADSKAAGALDRALTAHFRAGRRVRIARPRGDVKDFNDILKGVGS